MKRFFKLTALVLAVIMITVTLSSCRYLDELKENRAVYTDDTYNEISYHGDLYRVLDIDIDNSKTILLLKDFDHISSVTTPDVPILLSDMYGDSAYIYNDNTILSVYTSSCRYYIREDKYDEVKQTLTDAKLDHFYIMYSDVEYEEHTNSYRVTEEKYELLGDEATEVVRKALDSPESDRFKYTELGGNNTDYESIGLFVCDKDMLLTQNGNAYQLMKVNGKYYFWNGISYDKYGVYPISKDDSGCIEKIFKDYPGAIEYDNVGQNSPL